ncbi:hypothetical protein [Paraburkholderia susongensis]|uniref:Phage tail protein n=1 Tax=Paraburkholderia susongensis TaxID=1515439 RepID=A0A1X7LY44_9BURK|nr:hypothetical protein [Paraburkholderia susongensis]SMG58454.1 hypothetical protein SAMN06265784_11180 [Paraburkholderia susongensis]
MNLYEQLGALETGVDQLIQDVVARQAENIPETPAQAASSHAAAKHRVAEAAVNAQAVETALATHEAPDLAATGHANTHAPDATAEQAAAPTDAPADALAHQPADAQPDTDPPAPQLQPTLEINRPARDEITMTIGNQMVSLHPDQIGRLIEELSNARASMTPEQPQGVPPGWQFVSTKNPVMAVQKQSNGDRLLIMRHTGHGWVPFTFSPDVVIQMYMMLSNA